jgi:hypothetical protein
MTAVPSPLSLYDAQQALSAIRDQMRESTGELKAAHVALADAERDYRIAQAKAWAVAEGKNAPEREAAVQAATAGDRHARDIARGRIDIAKANLSRLDREGASVRFLGTWSQQQYGSAT